MDTRSDDGRSHDTCYSLVQTLCCGRTDPAPLDSLGCRIGSTGSSGDEDLELLDTEPRLFAPYDDVLEVAVFVNLGSAHGFSSVDTSLRVDVLLLPDLSRVRAR